MNQAVNGAVKWFNHSKGFGFIISESGKEVFVHRNDIEMSGYRYLRRGQRVRFKLVENGDSFKAIDVSVVGEAPQRSVKQPAVNETTNQYGSKYKLNERIMLEEDREHEFKSLEKARDPVRTISEYYIEKYVNAFLNTAGGVIYFGIDDAGFVHGIHLDRAQRDQLRTEVSRLINKFQPSIEPELYDIKFVEVQGAKSTYVVEIKVAKGMTSLYMTGSQNFFIRRDGSNFLMPFDMIRARLQAPSAPVSLAQGQEPSDLPEVSHASIKSGREQPSSEELDLGILLAMVFMSWSDENLSEHERQLLETRARDEGLEEQEVAMLNDATFRPPLLEAIVSYLPTPESRHAAATIAYLTALTDSVLTENELSAFDKMCQALGLSADERQDIRRLGEQRIG